MLRALIAVAFACLLGTSASAQTVLQLQAGAYDSDAQAYFNALSGNSCATPTVSYMQAISNFVVAEKAAGDWGNQDYRYVIVTTDSCTASINLAQPSLYKATITNTCTLTVASGMQGNATDCFLNPSVNQSAMKRYKQNSAHFLVCTGNSGGSFLIGTPSPTGGNDLTRLSAINNKVTRINSITDITDTAGGLAGCHYGDRTSSTTVNTGKNGVAQTTAGSATSSALVAFSITLCREVNVFCSSSQHIYYFEAGDIIPDEATHYTNIHALLVALGAVGAP